MMLMMYLVHQQYNILLQSFYWKNIYYLCTFFIIPGVWVQTPAGFDFKHLGFDQTTWPKSNPLKWSLVCLRRKAQSPWISARKTTPQARTPSQSAEPMDLHPTNNLTIPKRNSASPYIFENMIRDYTPLLKSSFTNEGVVYLNKRELFSFRLEWVGVGWWARHAGGWEI